MKKYYLKLTNAKFDPTKRKTVPNKRIEECALLCTDEVTFECKAFHFSYVSGECTLSSELSTNAKDLMLGAKFVDIYERNF